MCYIYRIDDSEKKKKYGGASIPMGILEEIEALINELGYWPSRSAFVRRPASRRSRGRERHA